MHKLMIFIFTEIMMHEKQVRHAFLSTNWSRHSQPAYPFENFTQQPY